MKTTQDGLGICQLKVSTLDKATHVHSLQASFCDKHKKFLHNVPGKKAKADFLAG